MAQIGSRRRKRNAIESSDDDDDITALPPEPSPTKTTSQPPPLSTSLSKPTRAPTLSQPAPAQRIATRNGRRTLISSSPTTTPVRRPSGRRAKKVKLGDKDKGKTADLATMPSNQSQIAKRREPTKTESSTALGKTAPLDMDDIFTSSDPISDDDFTTFTTSTASVVGQAAKKRQQPNEYGAAGAGSHQSSADPFSQQAHGSQRFKKPHLPARTLSPPDEDHRPWSERYGPDNLAELVVHKRKVADVRRWLEEVWAGRLRQRLLVLKGAAGSGKTTTLRLLAKDLGCDLLEWRNPTGSGAGLGGGQAAGFAAFLGAGGRFGALDVDGDDDGGQAQKQAQPPSQNSSGGAQKRSIILVEEFPSTFARGSSVMTAFRSAVQEFLARSTPLASRFGRTPQSNHYGGRNSSNSGSPVMPMVMIISETLLTTAAASADSFTAHRLLGPDILRHPGTGVVEFNAVAPTFLVKALELVVQKEARQSGRRRTPGPLVLKRLSEIGDVRSAISSLEFLCLKGDNEADWGSKVAATKTKRGGGGKGAVSLTRGEQDSLELVSQREASLGIFHAVGKVVYNKRDESVSSTDEAREMLPEYLRHRARPHPSLVSVDGLIDETGTDTHTFISALHENYALSCETTPADACLSVDYINYCLEYLSEADLLCPGRDAFSGDRGTFSGYGGRGAGSHILRQDEMAFQVASRGLLFSLPFPVRRKATPSLSGRGGDTHKLFYPTSVKLWRAKEEIEGLVDSWATKMLRGEGHALAQRRGIVDGASMFRRSMAAAPWSAEKGTSPPPMSKSRANVRKNDEPEAPPLVSLGNAARTEMVLERLPYTAHIYRGRARAGGLDAYLAMTPGDLDKMVTFRGVGPSSSDAADADDDDNDDILDAVGEAGGDGAWATDRPWEGQSPRKKKAPTVAIRHRDADQMKEGLPELDVRALVISDDDIEDD